MIPILQIEKQGVGSGKPGLTSLRTLKLVLVAAGPNSLSLHLPLGKLVSVLTSC